MQIKRSRISTFWNSYERVEYKTSYIVDDVNRDSRSVKVKTPRGAWRPPTAYFRNTDSGFVESINITGMNSWVDSGVLYRNTVVGAHDCLGRWASGSPAFPDRLRDQAITRALTKLKGQKVNLGQAFGERAQTGRLVVDSLKRITKVVRSAKNGTLWLALGKAAKKGFSEGDAFDAFLEYQYGWKPLLSDVYGAVSALADREKERNDALVTVVANVADTETYTDTVGGFFENTTFNVDRMFTYRYKGHIRLDFVQSDGVPKSTAAQLGLTNPLELAWELFPWSFVADWYIPIGQYLSLLDATNGWDFRGGSFSSKATTDLRPANARIIPAGFMKQQQGYVVASGQCRKMRFNREVFSSPPFPSRPHLKPSSNGVHVANGIALLMSAITGKVRVR